MIIWFTGQPGSGKTTLALAVEEALKAGGIKTFVIDGDILRGKLVPLGPHAYGEPARRTNVDRAQSLAIAFEELDIVSLVAVIAPYRDQRERFKLHCEERVLEIYLHTEEERGRESFFVEGYEAPQENFLDLDTGKLQIDECVEKICSLHRQMAAVS